MTPWRDSLATLTLLLLIIGAYLAQAAAGKNFIESSVDDLLLWGGNFAPLTLGGDWWRLPASMFLHAGLLHAAMNVYFLIIFGPPAERLFGHARFLFIYVASGLIGGLASAWWFAYLRPGGESVSNIEAMMMGMSTMPVAIGASGALMGIAGACLGAHLRAHVALDQLHISRNAIIQIVVLNLVLGFVLRGVDQACHIGGLVSGLALGYLCYSPWRQAAAAMAVSGLLVLGALHFGANEAVNDFYRKFKGEIAAGEELKRYQAQREAMQRQAQDDMAKRPPPVNAQQAGGIDIAVGKDPSRMILSADGKRLYVTSSGDNDLRVIDIATRTVRKTIRGGGFPAGSGGCRDNVCRGQGADGIAVRRDERMAYVTSMQADSLSAIDLQSGAIVGAVRLGRYPRDLVLSPDENFAYVMNAVDNTVSVVDLQRLQTVGEALALQGGDARHLPFGRGLWLLLHEKGRFLYVKNDVNGTVEIFDTGSRRQVKAVPTDFLRAPIAFPDERQLLAVAETGLDMLDAGSMQAVRKLPFCNGSWHRPRALAMSPDGTLIAALVREGTNVQVIKLATRRAIGVYPARSAYRILFATDGKGFYALDGTKNAVTFFDIDKSLDVQKALEEWPELLCWPERPA